MSPKMISHRVQEQLQNLVERKLYIDSLQKQRQKTDNIEKKLYFNRTLQQQMFEIEKLGKYHQAALQIFKQLNEYNDQNLIQINNKIKQFSKDSCQYLSLLSINQQDLFKYLLNQSYKNKEISFQIIISLLSSRSGIVYFTRTFPQEIEKFIAYAVVKFTWQCHFNQFEAPSTPRFATIFHDKFKLPDPEKQFPLATLSAQILEKLANNCFKTRDILYNRISQLFQALKYAQTVEILCSFRISAIVKILIYLIIRSRFDLSNQTYFKIIEDFTTRVVFFNNKDTVYDLQQEVVLKKPEESECHIIGKSGKIITQGCQLLEFKHDILVLGMLIGIQIFNKEQMQNNQQSQYDNEQLFVEESDVIHDSQYSRKQGFLLDEFDRFHPNNNIIAGSVIVADQFTKVYKQTDLQEIAQFKQNTISKLYRQDFYYIRLIISEIQRYKELDNKNYYQNNSDYDEYYQNNLNQLVDCLYKLSYDGLQYLSATYYGEKQIFDYLFSKSDQQVDAIQVVFGLVQFQLTTEYFVSSCSEHLETLITNATVLRSWGCKFDKFDGKIKSQFATIIPNKFELPDMSDLDVAHVVCFFHRDRNICKNDM